MDGKHFFFFWALLRGERRSCTKQLDFCRVLHVIEKNTSFQDDVLSSNIPGAKAVRRKQDGRIDEMRSEFMDGLDVRAGILSIPGSHWSELILHVIFY